MKLSVSSEEVSLSPLLDVDTLQFLLVLVSVKYYSSFHQVTSLSKDMEKLRLGEGSSASSGATEKMSESRKKELRRLSSKRRSSKQSKIIYNYLLSRDSQLKS